MILRRIIRHFRKQEWTAIFLDFVIVVLGVFVGMQVNNWNEGLSDGRREISYLTRLHDDVSDDIVMLEARLEFWEQTIAAGAFALDARGKPPGARDEAWRLISAYHGASNTVPINLRDGAYADMISSGQLRLISNTQLRDLTVNYYGNSWGVELSSLTPAYRLSVRRVIPPEIHAHMLPCHLVEGAHRHILADCPIPKTETDLAALAAALAGDENITGDLIQALSIMHTSTRITRDVLLPTARNLKAALAAELSRHGEAEHS